MCRTVLVVLTTVAIVLGASSVLTSGASAVMSDGSSALTERAKARFTECGNSARVVNTKMFGRADWVQERTLRHGDDVVQLRVYHPSGRWDEYRWEVQEPNGQVWRTPIQNKRCAFIIGVGRARPMARNGGAWHIGDWMRMN